MSLRVPLRDVGIRRSAHIFHFPHLSKFFLIKFLKDMDCPWTWMTRSNCFRHRWHELRVEGEGWCPEWKSRSSVWKRTAEHEPGVCWTRESGARGKGKRAQSYWRKKSLIWERQCEGAQSNSWSKAEAISMSMDSLLRGGHSKDAYIPSTQGQLKAQSSILYYFEIYFCMFCRSGMFIILKLCKPGLSCIPQVSFPGI